jgi:RNA polymerase subunit RPABC4/transcription elongation factor Spt4
MLEDVERDFEEGLMQEGDKVMCRDCRSIVFPIVYNEFMGESGPGGWVRYEECPVCGGDDFCEYHKCGECFEIIPEDEEYCEQCIEKVKRIVEDATDGFDRELRDLVLERILEG